jgi:hypothetical protein
VVAFIVAVLEEARSYSRIRSAQYIMRILPVVSGESTGGMFSMGTLFRFFSVRLSRNEEFHRIPFCAAIL